MPAASRERLRGSVGIGRTQVAFTAFAEESHSHGLTEKAEVAVYVVACDVYVWGGSCWASCIHGGTPSLDEVSQRDPIRRTKVNAKR